MIFIVLPLTSTEDTFPPSIPSLTSARFSAIRFSYCFLAEPISDGSPKFNPSGNSSEWEMPISVLAGPNLLGGW